MLLFLLVAAVLLADPEAASAQDPGRTNGTVSTDDDDQDDQKGLWPEPRVMSEGIAFVARMLGESDDEPEDGFYPEFGNMITGAGWISIGPGYRQHVLKNRALIDTSAAVSWSGYMMAQARIEVPHLAGTRLALGSQVMWQDFAQVNYFGLGIDSSLANQTNYRQATDFLSYATYKPTSGYRLGPLGFHQPDVSPAGLAHCAS